MHDPANGERRDPEHKREQQNVPEQILFALKK
jgi:hypothetical protein